jgi:2-dehydropantoate 2-reductase
MPGGPKVAILGAGSVGCFIGGSWAASGLDVTFIGRPKLSADIDEHGLTLTDYSGWQAHLPPGDVDYRCGPEGLGDAKVIALTVKSGSTAEAAAEIAAYATPGALVISFQNGISNVEVLEQGLGGRFEIARGMVEYNVAYLGQAAHQPQQCGQRSVRQDADR